MSSCTNANSGRCIKATSRMNKDSNFKVDVKSTVRAVLSANGHSYDIKATGCYSDLTVCVMTGRTKEKKLRTHWGLILKQQKQWVMDGHAARCMLFHHMGNGVEIAVGCMHCLQELVKNVYGAEVSHPKLMCTAFGRSRAAVGRFLGGHGMSQNVEYSYSSKYAKGSGYFHWRMTNCCRVAIDILFFLMLDYSVAVKIVHELRGDDKATWRRVYDLVTKTNGEFAMSIFNFYKALGKEDDLQKVRALLEKQFKLSKAQSLLINSPLWETFSFLKIA